MGSNEYPHFLLVTSPYQSHLNPTFQLAKLLILQGGARVTFVTTIHGLSKIKTFPSLFGLHYASFSDGFDDGTSPSDNQEEIRSKRKEVGFQSLSNLVLSLSREGHPVSFLVYCPILYWVAEVGRAMSIPSAFFCIQAATLFAMYYHCLNTRTGTYDFKTNTPPTFIRFEGMPLFESKDLPTYLRSNRFSFVTAGFQQHIKVLEDDTNPCVLVNTFDALEEFAIEELADSNIKLVTIGPLVPSNDFFGCDLFDNSSHDYYIQWLNSKPDCSVVYMSFGSFAVLQRNQLEEIFNGVMESGFTFLWVIRASSSGDGEEEKFENVIKEQMKEEQGLIVPWCSQVQVLNHRAIGCFVTHCGWNSTAECLVAGVPMVALPQMADQATNAKLIEHVWETGIRVGVNEGGVAEKGELRRCLELVMGKGQKAEEMRRNAKKWRELAFGATREGGSSANNFKVFMESL